MWRDFFNTMCTKPTKSGAFISLRVFLSVSYFLSCFFLYAYSHLVLFLYRRLPFLLPYLLRVYYCFSSCLSYFRTISHLSLIPFLTPCTSVPSLHSSFSCSSHSLHLPIFIAVFFFCRLFPLPLFPLILFFFLALVVERRHHHNCLCCKVARWDRWFYCGL